MISDIDECVETVPGEPPMLCGPNAHCENLQPGAECVCDEGYMDIGVMCIPAPGDIGQGMITDR